MEIQVLFLYKYTILNTVAGKEPSVMKHNPLQYLYI